MEIDVDRALEIAIAVAENIKVRKNLSVVGTEFGETEFVFSPQFLATAGADYTNPKGDGDPSMVWRVNFPSLNSCGRGADQASLTRDDSVLCGQS